jgi:ribonuclease HI
MYTVKIKLFFYGFSRDGIAGAGYSFVCREKEMGLEGSVYLGKKSNNQAEYAALVCGLEAVLGEFEGEEDLNIELYGSGQLATKQLRGEKDCRSATIRPYYKKAMKMLSHHFKYWSATQIPKNRNDQAGALAIKAINTMQSSL